MFALLDVHRYGNWFPSTFVACSRNGNKNGHTNSGNGRTAMALRLQHNGNVMLEIMHHSTSGNPKANPTTQTKFNHNANHNPNSKTLTLLNHANANCKSKNRQKLISLLRISAPKCLYTGLTLCVVYFGQLCTGLGNRHGFRVTGNVIFLRLGLGLRFRVRVSG